ncbi:MAG: hypothetical protein ABFQ53_03930 [Patescibacteria group bacterium]
MQVSGLNTEEFTWTIDLSVHDGYVRDLLEILVTGCRDQWGKNFFVEVHNGLEFFQFNLANYQLLPINSKVLMTDLVWLNPDWIIPEDSDDFRYIFEQFNFIVEEKDVVLRRKDENTLPTIPDGYELIESYDHLKQTDMFLHEGQWLLSTEPILEVDAIVAGKSVYHGNIPVIRKK